MNFIDSNSKQTIIIGYETGDPALNLTFENYTTFNEIVIINEYSNQTTSWFETCEDSWDNIFSDKIVLEAGDIIAERDSSDSEKVGELINEIKDKCR